MEKVEKKLTRFRATLKTKRKLSLPVFINQFQQQWAEQHGGAALGNGGLLEVASSASASSFGSLTSIPPAVEKERRNTSPGNPGLHELNRERLSCGGGGGGSASGSDSPYATMSRSGSRSRKGSAAFPHHQCHANLITSVSSPGGTTFLVPGSPPYPIVKLSLPGECRLRVPGGGALGRGRFLRGQRLVLEVCRESCLQRMPQRL